jgi:hypothetical protein
MASPTVDSVVKGNLVMHDHSVGDLGSILDTRYLQTATSPLTLPALSNGLFLTNNGTTLSWAAAGVTTGNLTEATSSILTITGGTNAVVGSGTTIQVKQATGAQSGFLLNTDWTTFNNKQAALTGSISGTSNQVTVSANSNSVASNITLSLPQNIHTAATPTFGGLISPYMKPSSNSTTALQWQNATGTGLITGDTTNLRVGISVTPLYKLDVLGTVAATGVFKVKAAANQTGKIAHLQINDNSCYFELNKDTSVIQMYDGSSLATTYPYALLDQEATFYPKSGTMFTGGIVQNITTADFDGVTWNSGAVQGFNAFITLGNSSASGIGGAIAFAAIVTDSIGSGSVNQVLGANFAVSHWGGASVTDQIGGWFDVSTASPGAAGTITNMAAGKFDLHKMGGSANVTNAYGFYLNKFGEDGTTSGTWTNTYGIRINSNVDTGNHMTNVYGIYLGNMVGTTISYAIYTNKGDISFGDNTIKFGIFGATPVVQQTDGAALTNNVTSGGTTNTIADITDMTLYVNDAANIRNDIYQLARKLKIVDDALRAYGLLT